MSGPSLRLSRGQIFTDPSVDLVTFSLQLKELMKQGVQQQVHDLNKAVDFYRDGLGWPQSSASVGDFAIFKLSTGTALALYPRHLLAADAKVKDSGGFGGVTLAQNVTDEIAHGVG